MSYSAPCHDGRRTAGGPSLAQAVAVPKVSRVESSVTAGLTAPGLAPSRVPVGTSFADADLVSRQALTRPSQGPIARAKKGGAGGPPDTAQVLDVVGKGGGRPLDPKVRADMEASLGSDFSDVRVHTDEMAAKSAAAISASAYTVGNEVVFGRGFFEPASHDGRHRLAHELVHVQQQRQGPVSGTDSDSGLKISDPGDSFEQEAERTAASLASGAPVGVAGGLHGDHQGKPPDQPAAGRSAQRCGGTPCDCTADEQAGVHGTSAGAPALQPLQRAALARSAGPVQRDDDPPGNATPGPSAVPTNAPEAPGDAPPSSGDDTTGTVDPLIGADSGLVEEDGASAEEAPTGNGSANIQTLPLQRDDAVPAKVRYPLASTVDPHEWSDFQGTPDKSRFAAVTKPKISLDANGFTINVFIDSAGSWVRSSAIGDGKTRNPADAKVVANCHVGFGKGHSWFQVTPSATCPAAAAIASSPRATTDGECDTVVGAALDRDRLAETHRLFRHELYHMRLAYAVAASAAASGDRRADLKKVKKANNIYQKMYDNQTQHGCKPNQSSWEQKIDAGNLNLDKPA